jgi:hypothetical protein
MQNIIDGHARETTDRIDGSAKLWVEGHVQFRGQQVSMVLVEVR